MSAEKIAIIGAGLAGSVLARTLVDAGADVCVIEKSGGTGGRLATRRTEHGAFNHGAQYLAAKTAPFRAMLTGLSHAGSVDVWAPAEKDRDAVWHIGKPGMSGVVKPLLAGIDLKSRTRVTELIADGDQVALKAQDDNLGLFDRVIVTAPAPQAFDLTVALDPVFQSLASVRYAPCWTAMAVFKGFDAVPEFVRGKANDAIGWMATAFKTEGKTGLVVQAGADWSCDHLELPKEEAAGLIIEAVQQRFDAPAPVHLDAHRWRYSLVERPLGTAFLASRSERVFVAGDGLLGGRAESAFESARQLGDHLKTLLA